MSKRKSSSVDGYRAKRDFRKTPEPPPGRRWQKSSSLVFVIHRHEARRLHYDLRIELDGVLMSWPVPKGFSYDPTDKRLAVRTEDHPLAYEDFDGVIPKGEYSAGTMTIWDRGRYEWLTSGDPSAAMEKGKLELRFYSGRLRGEWHMVKLKKPTNEWLLFKSRDRYTRDKDSPAFSIDLTRMEPKPLPQRLRPMLACTASEAFDGPDWLYELKLAGRRVLAERNGETIRFRGSRIRLAENCLQPIREALLQLKAEVAVVDGVLVCLDERQRPSRELLDQVLAGRADHPVDYYVFDLIYYEEWDLRSVPLTERKAALASILPAAGRLIFVEHERSRSSELIATIEAVGLDGCVAKRADSRYSGGPTEDWLEFSLQPNDSVDPGDLIESLSKRTGGASGEMDGLPENVRFTNLKKVLWPRDGYTKGDLIRYYDQVSDVLLPYLRDRPLSLHRFPDGVESESFFQKNTPAHFPEGVPTARVPDARGKKKGIRFVICQDRATLLYLANLACIELHPWSSRLELLDTPDWAILDLDPSTDGF
jgi:DNA ligase D-like protein (predicted 3'-phosphoesterase)